MGFTAPFVSHPGVNAWLQKIHDAIRATATRITLDYRKELDKILVTRGCYAGAQSPT
jgi:hypothetical protein